MFKKLTCIIPLFLLVTHSLIGQNEEAIIVFRLFKLHPSIQDEALKERIPNRLSAYLDKDLKIVEGNVIRLLDYTSIVEEFDSLFDVSTRVNPKYQYANYNVTGKIYPDEITVKVTDLNTSESKNTSVKWSQQNPLNPNALKKLAKNIKQKLSLKLIGESGGQLKLYNPSEREMVLLLNQDSLALDGKLTILPVSETGRINIQLIKDKQEKFVSVYAFQINRYQLVKRNGQLKLKNKRNNLSLTGNLFFAEKQPSFLLSIHYAYPIWNGLFIGVSGKLSSKLNYDLAYPTFDGLPIQNIQDFDYFNGTGFLFGYQRYFPKLKGEIGLNASIFLLPDKGYETTLFFVPEFLENFKINISYNILNLETNEIQFTPFGNAEKIPYDKAYKGFSFGIGYQFLF